MHQKVSICKAALAKYVHLPSPGLAKQGIEHEGFKQLQLHQTYKEKKHNSVKFNC